MLKRSVKKPYSTLLYTSYKETSCATRGERLARGKRLARGERLAWRAGNGLRLFVLVTREWVCILADAGAKADVGNGSNAGAFALFSALIAREIAHLVRGGRAL